MPDLGCLAKPLAFCTALPFFFFINERSISMAKTIANKPAQTSLRSPFTHHSRTSRISWRSLALAAGVSLALLGCGGGGSGDTNAGGGGSGSGSGGNNGGTDTGGGSGTEAQQGLGWQGRWVMSATATSSGTTALALPDADSTATVWLLANDVSTLSKLTVKADSTLSGKRYTLGSGNAAGVDLVGQYTVNQTAVPKTLILQGIAPNALTFNQTDVLANPANLADAVGSWKAKSGAVETSWTISLQAASLSIRGTSTTGCTWAGTGTAPDNVGLYKIDTTETCGAVQTAFKGIATVSSDNARMTVVATGPDEASALALLFSKSP
jgi:hypothetical protein